MVVLSTLPWGSGRQRQAKRALRKCSFDFNRLGVDIPVYEKDSDFMPGATAQFHAGKEVWLHKDMGPWTFGQTLIEELGHAVDKYCLNDEQRALIIAAYGGESWWKVEIDPATGRNKFYAYQIGETFAHQGFMLAYAPELYRSHGWPYPTTPKIAKRIKEIVG